MVRRRRAQLSDQSRLIDGRRRAPRDGRPADPNGGGNCIGVCSNVSIAYHVRLPHEEVYFAYGDSNTLTTVPQALLKVIFSVGSQKGT